MTFDGYHLGVKSLLMVFVSFGVDDFGDMKLFSCPTNFQTSICISLSTWDIDSIVVFLTL